MDIMITLPKFLWGKIIRGEKSLELRKNMPRLFNVKIDRVFVCVKGTHKCYGYFRVSWFQYCRDDLNFIIAKQSRIQVPPEWIKKYLKGTINAYLWHIKEVYPYSTPLDITDIFKVKRAPQSFCYV